MADNSSNNTSGSNNWRNRVGVKGTMPKLSDEFKSDSKSGSAPPPPRSAPGRQPASGSQRPAPGSQPASGSRPAPKPVARTAPMAPRRPVAPVAPERPAPTPVGSAQPASPKGDTFGDRLRAQREAAEALAKKRADETRDRIASGSPAGAPQTGGGPKFSFAEEEIKAAASENPVPSQAPTNAPQPQPRAPFKPQHTGNTGSVPRPYQPSDAYRKTHGYREYDGRTTVPPPQNTSGRVSEPAYNRYAESEAGQENYSPPQQRQYQPPTSRGSEYYEDGNDDLFDDREVLENRRPSSRGVGGARKAEASEYTAAYRDYDEAFDYEEEPRGRSGVWVFALLMLLVVAAIGAGAVWFLYYGTKIGSDAANKSAVPTVAAPQNPVKVEPKAVDTTTPGAPVRRKKIYDRILGNQTLEPEKLTPSEEAPKTPPPAVVPGTPPTGEAPVGVEPLPLPLPPPPTVPGVQGSLTQKTNKIANAAPNIPPNTTGVTELGQTTIAPTSSNQNTSTIQAGGQQAPLPLPGAPPVSQTTETNNSQTTTNTENNTETATVSESVPLPPLPRSKPTAVIAQARQSEEQRRLAALTQSITPVVPQAPRAALPGGTGPVQIGPGTSGSQNFNSSTPTVQAPIAPQVAPRTAIASLPQPQVQPTVPQRQVTSPGGGYVLQMSSFRNRNAASAEYRRLVTSHASILRGLSPEIQEADLGASGKFYKLRLGSVADRTQAARLCNSLIAAGEKDCLVRSR